MSDSLIFLMGEYEAQFPTDRLYATNHMWGQRQEGETSCFRFGFTAYAVRLLQDVYFLDWMLDAPVTLRDRQEIGAIESKKAESDLFAPAAGLLSEFNSDLIRDPSQINVDGYGAGWLFEMQCSDDALMSCEAYLDHLESVWEVTQKTIKGQLNS